MALKDVFKVSRKTFFYPTAWLGYNELKRETKTTWDIIKDVTTPPEPTRKETFAQAMQRLKLTDADVENTAHQYTIYTWLFLFLGAGTFAASFFYLFYHGTFFGWILGLSTAALFFVQAFRFDFWLFQIRHRKLGCTFEEWKRGKPFPEERV